MRKQISLVKILIGINITLYVVTVLLGGPTLENLILLGAKFNLRIADGEYYRLLTSMFLHANIYHLLFNNLALYVLGQDIERIYGKGRFLIIYMSAGLFGSLGSYLFNPSIAIGASGAIFGLLGANLYLYHLNKDAYRRIYGNQMIVLLGINVAFGFMMPQIDNYAHLAGLFGGYACAWATGIQFERRNVKIRPFLRVVLPLFFAAALFFGTQLYIDSFSYYFESGIDAIRQNDLRAAQESFEKARELKPDDPDLLEILQYFESN